jgi:hypothetical protein
MATLIGEKISPKLKDQLEVRQATHGSGVLSPRTHDQLVVLNANNSWIKLASGVSITSARLSQSGLGSFPEKMGLAQQNVLFGGTSDYTIGGLHQKPGNESYEFSEFGFVPMAGINNISVKSLNRGAIKKATVSITAHSKRQFEILNLLYMHLGYTVMLEWGNAFYLNNSQKLQKVGNTLIEDIFFKKSSNGSYSDILPILEKYRKNYDYNYDGMLGKITNYSWSFKKDGTYDIELNLISMGDVVESLKTNISVDKSLSSFLADFNESQETTGAPPAIEAGKSGDLLSSYLFLYQFVDNEDTKKNATRPDITINNGDKVGVFLNNGGATLTAHSKTYQFYEYTSVFGNPTEDGGPVIFTSPDPEKDAIDALYKKYLARSTDPNKQKIDDIESSGNYQYYSDFLLWIVSMKELASTAPPTTTINNPINNDPPNVAIKINATTPQYYIKMEYVLNFLKNRIIPNIKSTPNNVPLVDLVTSKASNIMYRIGDIHVSLDPRVCIVRNDGFRELDTDTGVVISKAYPELPAWSDSNKNKAYLNNIYLNFTFVISCMNNSQDSKGNSSLFELLTEMCNGINKALGGVNNLEPTIDETTNSIRIIDSTPIPNSTSNPPGEDLVLFGYEGDNKSNFARKLDIKTTVPPEMATMISVGVTSGGYVKGIEATAFAKWNKGIDDRFKVEYIPPNVSSSAESATEVQDNYVENFVQNDAGAYGLDAVAEPRTFTDSVITKNVATVSEYYRYVLSTYKNSGGSVGFIPFKISFTLDGISGFKIYNKIKLNLKFLSKDYQNFLNFIVTEINHKVNDQDWETEISAILHPNTEIISPVIKKAKQIKNIARTPPFIPGSVGASPDGPAITGGDADFWTLLAICIFEDGDDQGRADVAQSIYNRVAAGPSGGYGALSTSIAGVIKSNKQYEPAYNRSNGGPDNMDTHPNWKAITDKTSAIKAIIGNTEAVGYNTPALATEALKKVYEALKNPTLQQEARNFIGPRTDFLGESQGDVAARNASTGSGTAARITFVMRLTNRKNNVFGFAGTYTGASGTALPPPQTFWDKYLSEF